MDELIRFAVAHLRGSTRRTVAAIGAILVAITSFVVLTGTVTAQRLQVTQTVANNYRSTYDILVRPKGSAGPIELSDNLVRPNFLAGSYGGITLDQVKQVAAVPGVDVAAPVAVLGQTMHTHLFTVDVGSILGSRDEAMVRFSLTGAARNGTAHTSGQHGYLYLTKRPLTDVDLSDPDPSHTAATPARTESRGGSTITACLASDAGDSPANPAESFYEECASPTDDLYTPIQEFLIGVPLTVEAIDPDAEARLTGLDRAITAGRALTEADAVRTTAVWPDGQQPQVLSATAVMADKLPFDYQATMTVEEMPSATIDAVMATTDAAARRRLVLSATPTRVLSTVTRDAATLYRDDLPKLVQSGADGKADQSMIVDSFLQPGDVRYTGTDPLAPRIVAFDKKAWGISDDYSFAFHDLPTSIADTGYRPVVDRSRTDSTASVNFQVVGSFDADRLPRPSALNEVPLETYRPSMVTGADAASRAVLGDQPLRSDLNPAGYVQSPPALLVSLKAMPTFWKYIGGLDQKAPVSSVRVRVAGITGMDAVNRERIRQVADTIAARTGLQVDITIGASLTNRRIDLPATASGTPALRLNEQWTKKGVAVAISQALDLKSLVLFLLILVSSALTVALIATATVAARRRELATLACVGWPNRRIGALVGTELGLLGLGAGVLGAAISWPLATVLGISVAWWQVALAVPLGAVLAVLPSLVATVRASRVVPLEAFRPKESRSRRWAGPALAGPASLGLLLNARRPGRASLGALAVALAVAAGVVLATIVRGFNGAVVGSFLGDAVALQVRGPDVAAAVVLAVLGLTAVGTVLLVALVEDAPSFAALQATGWTDRSLATTLVTQAGTIGLSGAVVGAAIALVATAVFVGPVTWVIAGLASVTVLVAVAATCAAALVPALALRRLPTARILSGE